jgi:hypothetical protein
MTSVAQTEANRRNAQRSTGPRSISGKARSARNATRHGCLSAAVVIPGEVASDWEVHLDGVIASLAPVGALEARLAERMAFALWRLNRVVVAEAKAFAPSSIEERLGIGLPPVSGPLDEMSNLMRYEAQAMRAYTHARTEFHEARVARQRGIPTVH